MSLEALKDATLSELEAELSPPTSSEISLKTSVRNPPLEWKSPILFNEVETPAIPTRLLPGIYGEFAQALATSTETPSALSVMTILGVISVAAARHFRVTPKDGWNEPLNIYTITGLPPANNKTQILNACTRPLIEWERDQAEKLQPLIKNQWSERKTQEKIIESLRSKAARTKDSIIQQELIKDIARQENELIEPKTLPRLFANDVTPESLTTAVCEQQGHFAIFSDEGGIIEVLTGLYSGGAANVDILLKGIDGGCLRLKRKDRSIDLNPYLTVTLVVQPAVIQKMAAKRAFSGNGLLERFLYVLPKSNLGNRTHDKPPVPEHIISAYDQKIKALLNFPFVSEKPLQPGLLTLSPKAYQEWRAFQNHIEIELRPDGRLSPCTGWGGKICGFALRIAGLIHIAKNDFSSLVIEEETMANALELASLLSHHVTAAYNLMGIGHEITQDAKEVFAWIITEEKLCFTRSEITYAMRHKKLKPERLTKALSLLIERHILSSEEISTRKPTSIFHVNPALKKKGGENGMA